MAAVRALPSDSIEETGAIDAKSPKLGRRASVIHTHSQILKDKVLEEQLEQQRLEQERPDEDDGFVIKQLMVTLFHLVQSKEARQRGRKQQRTIDSPACQDTELGPPSMATKLLKCIKRVLETTASRRNQEKLQDFVLDFLNRVPEPVKPKEVQLAPFFAKRKNFWEPNHASTNKWEGVGSLMPESIPANLKPLDFSKPSKLLAATTASATYFASKGIAPHRKDMDTLTAIKQIKRRSPETMRTRFGLPKQDDCDSASEADSSPEFFQMKPSQRRASCKIMLNKHVGDSVMCPASKTPQLLPAMPDWKDLSVSRRAKLRSAGTSDESAWQHDKRCTCGTCKAKSRRLLDSGQSITRRVFAKPITKITGYDDLECMVEKSRSKPLSKCGSLPIFHGAQAVASNTELSIERDPVNPPYGRLPIFPDVVQSDETAPFVKTGAWRYLQACRQDRVTPKLQTFLFENADVDPSIGAACSLDLRARGYTDKDLGSICEGALTCSESISEIDMSRNGFSDKAIASFLCKLPGRHVHTLDLTKCGAEHRTISAVCNQLEDSWPRLTVLRLRGCRMATDNAWEELVSALLDQGKITDLCLAETQLGYASQRSVQLFADVVRQANYLEKLDISGNYLFYEGFQYIASSINMAPALHTLDVSHNASFHNRLPRRTRRISPGSADPNYLSDEIVGDIDGALCENLPSFSPVALLCEALIDNKRLVDLRLSNSGVDFCADCALLVSLVYNRTLQYLDISYNPHGDSGLRAIFRFLMINETVRQVDTSNHVNASLGPGVISTDLGTPTGKFNLELSHPQHRSLLRWLLYRAKSLGVKPPQAAFSITSWSKTGIDWKREKENGNGWEVPQVGRLEFTFDVPLELDKEQNARDAVRKWQVTRRMPIPLRRFVVLFVMYDELATGGQKEDFVRAMGETLVLKTCQLMKFIKSNEKHCTEIARNLYGNTDDNDPMLFFDLIKYKEMAKSFRFEARQRFNYNVRNPTNRYVLDLDSPLDRAVAEQLHVVNNFEKARAEKLSAADVSQHHNHEGARDISWESKPCKSFSKFKLEEYTFGRLRLDYTSPPWCAPSRRERPTTDIFVSDILDALEGSNACQSDKIMALRNISHHLVLTPEQVYRFCRTFSNPFTNRPAHLLWFKARRVMKKPSIAEIADGQKRMQGSAFSSDFENARAEVFICLFNRCLEWPVICRQECLYDSRLFTLNCAKAIRQRLGFLRTFDALDCCRAWRFVTTPPSSQLTASTTGEALGRRPSVQETHLGLTSSALSGGGPSLDGTGSLAPQILSPSSSSHLTAKGAAKASKFAQLVQLRKAIEDGMDEEKASFEMEPGRRYEFDISVSEQWSCLFFLCCLATKEEGDGLTRCSWSERARMREQGYDFIPPPEWAVEGPDQKGTFYCTYMSEADEYINVKARRGLAERFCGWEKS